MSNIIAIEVNYDPERFFVTWAIINSHSHYSCHAQFVVCLQLPETTTYLLVHHGVPSPRCCPEYLVYPGNTQSGAQWSFSHSFFCSYRYDYTNMMTGSNISVLPNAYRHNGNSLIQYKRVGMQIQISLPKMKKKMFHSSLTEEMTFCGSRIGCAEISMDSLASTIGCGINWFAYSIVKHKNLTHHRRSIQISNCVNPDFKE